MIRGNQLFGRDAISPNEKKIVKAANKTAQDLFKRRFSPDLAKNWDVDVKQLTIEMVEADVLEAILKKYPQGGREYAKKAIC